MTRKIALLALLVSALTDVASATTMTTASARPTAASLLTERVVRTITKYRGELAPKVIVDGVYDELHFEAIGMPEPNDVALRVWRIGGDAGNELFDNLHRGLPNVVDTTLIGDRAFTAEEPEIYGVIFQDDRGLVAMLTCGKQHCQTAAVAMELARRVRARLPAHW
jgi:hypothetical protein